jgi:hypothetical protein
MELDDAARARIARGWASSCLTQAEYAAKYGVSDRALRAWVARFGGGSRPEARVRAVIEKAITDLEELLAALDAEAERLAGSGEGNSVAEAPERPAASASPQSSPPTPRPMPRGFFSGLY